MQNNIEMGVTSVSHEMDSYVIMSNTFVVGNVSLFEWGTWFTVLSIKKNVRLKCDCHILITDCRQCTVCG